MSEKLLEIKNLSVEYDVADEGVCKAVNDVSFSINKGETLGLVGETGAGKTTIALSILQLLPIPPAVIRSGEILFNGEDLLKKNNSQMRSVRGKHISMIFQDPMSALNPVDKVGTQIAEVIQLHTKLNKKEALRKALEVLEMVGIPAERGNEYPHQFSGGMKQRIVIAIALACRPELIIADEPTTALDVTIQAQVLDLMNKMKQEIQTSMILITHDLGIVAQMCERVAVIYAGEIVEIGTVEDIFDFTSHPYTKGLFDSLPDVGSTATRLKPIPGMMPDPMALPKGCKFAPRCPYKTAACEERPIDMAEMREGHFVRCLAPLKTKEG